jgi:hypothetical protein
MRVFFIASTVVAFSLSSQSAFADFTNFPSSVCAAYAGTRTLCIDENNIAKYASLTSDQAHRKLTIDQTFFAKKCVGGCTGVIVTGVTLDLGGAFASNVIRIDGVGNVKIQNSTILGGETGIFITGGAHDIDIINNNIQGQQDIDSSDSDLAGRGVRVSNATSSNNILIKDNSIFNTESDGIIIAQNDTLGVAHANISIIHNTIAQVAKNKLAWPGHYHGIYAQSGGITIQDNTITYVADGNGISVRNSGVIQGNIVQHTGKAGIGYFADHKRLDNIMVISNNNIYDTGENADACCLGQPAIRLLPVPASSEYYVGTGSPKNDSTWYVQNFTISGNFVSGLDQIQNQDPTRFTVTTGN